MHRPPISAPSTYSRFRSVLAAELSNETPRENRTNKLTKPLFNMVPASGSVTSLTSLSTQTSTRNSNNANFKKL